MASSRDSSPASYVRQRNLPRRVSRIDSYDDSDKKLYSPQSTGIYADGMDDAANRSRRRRRRMDQNDYYEPVVSSYNYFPRRTELVVSKTSKLPDDRERDSAAKPKSPGAQVKNDSGGTSIPYSARRRSYDSYESSSNSAEHLDVVNRAENGQVDGVEKFVQDELRELSPRTSDSYDDYALPSYSENRPSKYIHEPKFESLHPTLLQEPPDAHFLSPPRQLALRRQFMDQQQYQFSKDRPTYISIDLDFPTIVAENFESDSASLWDAVVLVGHYTSRWAGSIGEYVTRAWPYSCEHIKKVLELLSKANVQKTLDSKQSKALQIGDPPSRKRLQSDLSVKIADEQQLGFSKLFEVTPNMSLEKPTAEPAVYRAKDGTTVSAITTAQEGSGDRKTIVCMTGDLYEQTDLIEALAWLQVVLTNRAGGPFECDVSLRRMASTNAENVYKLFPRASSPISRTTRASCWIKLLPNTACATNFSTDGRPPDALGLEVTFDLLCLLTGARYEIDYKGGIVLYGDHSMIYPQYITGDCVQWHFKSCAPDQSPHCKIKGERLLNKDLDEIRNFQRHIIGLWSEPDVTLGTESLDYHKLRFSRAEQVSETMVKDNIAVGGSISLPRVLSLSGTISYKFLSTRKTHFMRGSVVDNLYGKIASPIMLYSPQEKRAWLVSYVSVVLHLARCRALLRAELNHRMPACDRSANGGRAAWECIRRCHNDQLKVPDEDEVLTELEKATTIGHHVQEVVDCIELTRRTRGRAKGFFRDRILGYELADVARFKDSMTMKKCSLEYAEGWGPLLDNVELVFFYEGLSDPIVPSANLTLSWVDAGACSATAWHEVPKGYNLLTASMPCLRYLAETWGEEPDGSMSQLANGYTWHCPMRKGPFSTCNESLKCKCNRIQEVRRSALRQPLPRSFFHSHPEGAVVFNFDSKPEEIRTSIRAANKRRKSSNNSLAAADSGYWSGSIPRHSSASSAIQDESGAASTDEDEAISIISENSGSEDGVEPALSAKRTSGSRTERREHTRKSARQPLEQEDLSEADDGSLDERDASGQQLQLVKRKKPSLTATSKSPQQSSEISAPRHSESRRRHKKKQSTKDADDEPKKGKTSRTRKSSSNGLARWMLPIR